ncbi:MAG: lytic transglycosylase domain-containing protein, partial [Sphingomonadaceae bacterium]|nr:lytic transglycosylase domain-containing protein [Sphingomonadaceae bacterium]
MSSMDRISLTAIAFASLAISGSAQASPAAPINPPASLPVVASEAGGTVAADWDQARADLVAQAPGRMAAAIQRWEVLTGGGTYDFGTYASFLTRYPGFPKETLLRRKAEARLDSEAVPPEQLVAYFERIPPLTNPARARYALALASLQRPNALEVARAAWRGGEMSGPTEAYLVGLFGGQFSEADHAARMDALLWQNEQEAAARQAINVGPQAQSMALARLSLLSGALPEANGLPVPANAMQDPGYVYNLVRYYRTRGQSGSAANLLANRPQFNRLPHNAEAMVVEMLRVAREGSASDAARIAGSVDDLFAPGTDIRNESYRTRDDYTSLMWLGGTKALWTLG